MTKVKFIKKCNPSPCHNCEGTGYMIGPEIHRKDALKHPCKVCKGSGIWVEDNYYLITTPPNGQKIGFQVDGLK